jgi:hypothetical protein
VFGLRSLLARGLVVAVMVSLAAGIFALAASAFVTPPSPRPNLKPSPAPAAKPVAKTPPRIFAVGPKAYSTAIGPMYPPQGGVTLTEGGGANMIVSGGHDWTFSALDQTQYSALYWGPAPTLATGAGRAFGAAGLAADGAINTAGEGMAFDASQPDLATGKEYWTGSFVFGTTTYPSRLVITVTDAAGTTPIPLVLATTVTGVDAGAGAVASITGTSFKVNITMQMQATVGVWSDPKTWFDALTVTKLDGGLVSSFDGGFWYDAASFTAITTNQYHLTNSDGVTWQEIDPSLRLSITPGFNVSIVAGGNLDLFTANAGYNQDIAIFVSVNGGADSMVSWKESGGFAGTFSPNAAFVEGFVGAAGGQTYLFKLKWRTNKPANGTNIYAAAGPLPSTTTDFSPTRLTAKVTPAAPQYVTERLSISQYHLTHSNGATWQEIDPGLAFAITATADGSAIVGANVDLFTAKAGLNQDVAIFVSDNGGADTLVGWKESGGFAGTFSPNAAYLQTLVSFTATHQYLFKLMWKTNKPAGTADTIYAGAGPLPSTSNYSPTRMLAIVLPSGANPSYSSIANTQYSLTNNNGSTWVELDPTHLETTVAPTADTWVIAGANLDLWTATAGFNQDVALFVSDNGGADELLGWKESGGFAGTFSPNAAYLQVMKQLTGGHSYVFKVKWKTNKPGSSTIYVGAGPLPGGTSISPTRVTVLATT